jgi:peptidoglycan/LPS O-acetylase OafA/YrhL
MRTRIPVPELRAALSIPFFALLTLGAARGARGFRSVLAHPALVALGDASYSLYILQVPIALWLLELLHPQDAPASLMSMGMGSGFFLGYVATLVIISLVTFRFFERPAQRLLRECLGERS